MCMKHRSEHGQINIRFKLPVLSPLVLSHIHLKRHHVEFSIICAYGAVELQYSLYK